VLAEKVDDNEWLVPSSNNGTRYRVGVDFDIWHCDCDDMRFRGAYTLCRHILLVQMLQALQTLEEQIEMVVA